jgi:tRNA G37 N-methylase Trm5
MCRQGLTVRIFAPHFHSSQHLYYTYRLACSKKVVMHLFTTVKKDSINAPKRSEQVTDVVTHVGECVTQ